MKVALFLLLVALPSLLALSSESSDSLENPLLDVELAPPPSLMERLRHRNRRNADQALIESSRPLRAIKGKLGVGAHPTPEGSDVGWKPSKNEKEIFSADGGSTHNDGHLRWNLRPPHFQTNGELENTLSLHPDEHQMVYLRDGYRHKAQKVEITKHLSKHKWPVFTDGNWSPLQTDRDHGRQTLRYLRLTNALASAKSTDPILFGRLNEAMEDLDLNHADYEDTLAFEGGKKLLGAV